MTSWIWPVNTLLTLSFVIKLSSTKRCSHTDIRDDTIWWEDMGSREELNWLLNKWWQLDEWGTSDQPAVIKSSLGFLSKPWWQWQWECHQTKDSTSRTMFVLYKFLYISNIIITKTWNDQVLHILKNMSHKRHFSYFPLELIAGITFLIKYGFRPLIDHSSY